VAKGKRTGKYKSDKKTGPKKTAPPTLGRGKRPPTDMIARVEAFGGYSMIVNPKDYRIYFASKNAQLLPLGIDGYLQRPELVQLVAETWTSKENVTKPIELLDIGQAPHVIAQATVLRKHWVLLIMLDHSAEIRSNEIRRDFVSNLSHELRTPITAVGLLGQAILAAGDDLEAVRHFAKRLDGVASRLEQLVEDMLTLSAIEENDHPEFTPVDIFEVVDKAAGNAADFAEERKIELQYTKRKHAPVLGNLNALVAAVENLLINAIKYSPVGSKVAVTTRTDEAEGEATISVIDQGIGIAPEDQERVFERFYRTDEARSRQTGGTGLGLSIVKNTALAHGGNISLYSIPGVGSTFSLTLPLLVPTNE
jgi:two-component system sensor histidine kinase SenX3